MARLSRPRRCPNSVTVGAWSARRALPLCRPSSAAILHPVVSIGSSLNILKMPPMPPPSPPPPPPASFVRRPSEDGRRSDRSEAGPSMRDGIGDADGCELLAGWLAAELCSDRAPRGRKRRRLRRYLRLRGEEDVGRPSASANNVVYLD
uniref:Uncharacterized protein n=1 Tax=Oryza brachyantha TaxID=4533 RepID=J3MTT4_ORYBR